jgi:hypothetical protein
MAGNLTRLVQLIFDRNAAKKAEDDAKKTLGGIDGALSKLKLAAGVVGAALVAAFGIHALIAFGKSAVEEAMRSEKAWLNLAGTIRAAGGDFESMEHQLRATGLAMQDITTHSDEDYAEALTRLITLTGDVTAATNNMGLVANVAAQFFGGDLAEAAGLVGKVMNGNLMILQRMGIHAKNAQEALELLAQRGMGAAERQTHTFSGRLAVLNNLWGEFKEQLGLAMIANNGTSGAMDTLVAAVRLLTTWIESNKDALRSFVSNGVDLAVKGTLQLAHALALASQASALLVTIMGGWLWFPETARQFRELTADLTRQTGAMIDAYNVLRRPAPTGGWVETTGRWLRGQASWGTHEPVSGASAAGLNVRPVVAAGARLSPEDVARRKAAADAIHDQQIAEEEDSNQLAEAAMARELELQKEHDQLMWDEADRTWERKKMLAESSQAEIERIQTKSADNLLAQIEEQHQRELALEEAKAKLIGDVVGAAMVSGLGPFAAMKMRQNLIEAAEEAVRGFTDPFGAPLHFAAAAKHLEIAAAWGLLSRGLGGGGTRIGGGGGLAASRASSASSAARTAPQNEVHIYLIGPGFHALNPAVQRVVFGAEQAARERYGENVHLSVGRGR